MLDQLSADRKKSVAALAEVHASLASSISKMKHGLDESKKRVEKRLEGSFSSIDAKFEKISQRLEKTEENRDGNAGAFSEIIERMSHRLEQIEQERSTGEHPLNEAVGNIARRLDRVEQEKNTTDQPLNEAVGNIVQRLEHIEQLSAGSGASVDETIAELKSELKSVKDCNEKTLSEVRSSLAEVKKELADPARTQSQSSYSDLNIEKVSGAYNQADYVSHEKDRSVAEIIEDLTKPGNGEDAPGEEDRSEEIFVESHDSGDAPSVVATTFDQAQTEENDSVSPDVEGAISYHSETGDAEIGETDADDETQDRQDHDEQETLVTPGDYLSGARRAAQAAAEAASERKQKQSRLQSLASRVTSRATSRDEKSGFFERNRIAAIGAAILLIGGAGAFLLSRGSAPATNNSPVDIIAVTPAEQAVDIIAVTPAEQIDVAVPATPFDQAVAETDSAAFPALATGVENANIPGTEAEDNLAGLASEVDGEAVSNPAVSGPNINNQVINDQVVNEMAIDGPSVSGPQIEAAAEPTMLEQLTSEARAGSSSAALILGLNYLNGDGVVESESEAFR